MLNCASHPSHLPAHRPAPRRTPMSFPLEQLGRGGSTRLNILITLYLYRVWFRSFTGHLKEGPANDPGCPKRAFASSISPSRHCHLAVSFLQVGASGTFVLPKTLNICPLSDISPLLWEREVTIGDPYIRQEK